MIRFKNILFIVFVLLFSNNKVQALNDSVIIRVKTNAFYEVIKKSNKLKVNIDVYDNYFFLQNWDTVEKIKHTSFFLDNNNSNQLLSMIDSLLYLPFNYSMHDVSGLIEIPLNKKIKTINYSGEELMNKGTSGRENAGEHINTLETPSRIIKLLTNLKNQVPEIEFIDTVPVITAQKRINITEYKTLPKIISSQACAYFKISGDTVSFSRAAFGGRFILNNEEYNKILNLLNNCNTIVYCKPFIIKKTFWLTEEGSSQNNYSNSGNNVVVEAEPAGSRIPDKLMIDDITYLRFDANDWDQSRKQHLIYKFIKNNIELSNYERFISYIYSLCDKYIINDPEDKFYRAYLARDQDGPLFYNTY